MKLIIQSGPHLEHKQQKVRNIKSRKTLLAELKACSNLQRGREIHADAIASGNGCCIYVVTALVKMYAKLRSMLDAHEVFNNINYPDVVLWTALILGYADNGQGLTALDLFAMMKSQGCAPDAFTFVAVLKACTCLALDREKTECLKWGKQIHNEIGWHSNIHVQNTLINMYAKCGSMIDASQVFYNMKNPDVVSWTALILGYAENGEGGIALNYFSRMSCLPDHLTFVAAFKACSSLAAGSEKLRGLDRGRRIHLEIGWHSHIYVQNTLIDMYAMCGSMVDARQVFDNMKHPNLVSWNALISGYAENGEGLIALDSFSRMRVHGFEPDSFTFLAAINACASLAHQSGGAECLQWGKRLHSEIGCNLDKYVQNALIDMYAKCGSMFDAQQVFDSMKQRNVVSWNTLILGYVVNGKGEHALNLFTIMKYQGCVPNSTTFIAALKACAHLEKDGGECLQWVKQIHLETGCHLDSHIENTLVDVYANSGSMVEARQVFENMQNPDVVSWTALILGYAENRQGKTALELFARMKSQGLAPDCITFVAVLKACGSLGALELGRKFHAEINIEAEPNIILVNCLVDFYAKSGSLLEAQQVFDSHPKTRDLKTWTALLAGYSSLGDNETVFNLFERMIDAGFQPNDVTFLCILTCCSHAGLVDKASEILNTMYKSHGIFPTLAHYNCMVDILGRANKLEGSMALIRSMPFRPTSVTWKTVLGACHKWKNVGIGRLAFLSLDNADVAAYASMASIYNK